MEKSFQDLISVGISVYNAENFIENAIKSVLQQTKSNFELIIINDGSTDNSGKIINHYRTLDTRIRVIDDGKNKGLISRLNELVAESKGKYFVRMDADDIMFRERLEVQFNFLKKNEGIDLVHSTAISIDNDNNILGIRDVRERAKTAIIHPTVFAKRSFFINNPYHGGYPQMEDMELWYRTCKTANFGFIEQPLLFYREESSKISAKHKKMLPGLLKFAKTYDLSATKIWLMNRFKFYLYVLAENFGLQKVILERRFKILKKEEVFNYAEKLNKIIKS